MNKSKLDPQNIEEPTISKDKLNPVIPYDYQESFNSTGTVIIKSKNQE